MYGLGLSIERRKQYLYGPILDLTLYQMTNFRLF